MKSERLLLIAGLLSALPPHSLGQSTINPAPFSALYAFGDCLTDTHNVAPQFSNWRGRFSNGPMCVEYISTNLNLSYAASNNFAVAAYTTLDVLARISNFPAPNNASNALFVIWAGPVDFYNPVLPSTAWAPGAGPFVSPTNDAFWNVLITQGVNNLSNAVVSLYAKGARSFLVPNVDDLSRQPVVISNQTKESLLDVLRQRVQQFNAALAQVLGSLGQSWPDVRIINPDFFGLISAFIDHPADYGMTKPYPAAMQDPALGNKSLNGPGADYVFWDAYGHPTTKAHALIAARFLADLTQAKPESLSLTHSGDQLNVQMEKLLIGRAYSLEVSPDLANWKTVLAFNASTGTNLWSQPSNEGVASFFRLIWPP
jgi:phospholipase/lecithinase/hemolysin